MNCPTAARTTWSWESLQATVMTPGIRQWVVPAVLLVAGLLFTLWSDAQRSRP